VTDGREGCQSPRFNTSLYDYRFWYDSQSPYMNAYLINVNQGRAGEGSRCPDFSSHNKSVGLSVFHKSDEKLMR